LDVRIFVMRKAAIQLLRRFVWMLFIRWLGLISSRSISHVTSFLQVKRTFRF